MGVLKGRVCRATTAAYYQCELNDIGWYRYHLKRGGRSPSVRRNCHACKKRRH
jgi:hypothetical protein